MSPRRLHLPEELKSGRAFLPVSPELPEVELPVSSNGYGWARHEPIAPDSSSAEKASPAEPVAEAVPVTPGAGTEVPRLGLETWREFERTAGTSIPCLIEGLWPEGALGFTAGPPKTGKTWVGLAQTVSVACGRPFLGFKVPQARRVLYIALEGHRAAICARIGALARGLDIDPDGDELVGQLYLSYKPRGINLADAGWANALREEAVGVGASLVVVDVLRRAAQLDENSSRDFLRLVANLEPLLDDGVALDALHHYGKLTELSKERTPGERMTGTGAMFGALDVGIFITGSERGARKLRLEFDGRDLAMPDPLGVELHGEGSGKNGSFTYSDRCLLLTTADAPDRTELKAPPSEIAAFIVANDGQARPGEILDHFGIAESTLRARRADLLSLGIDYVGQGKTSVCVAIHPVPATPRPPRGNASRGANPHGSEGLSRDPAHPATGTSRGYESGELQGERLPRDPALPTGATSPSRGSAPEMPDGDLEWR